MDSPGVQLWQGDCLALLGNIPDGTVDAVITDPPYGISLKNNCKNGQTPKRRERSFGVVGDSDSAVARAAIKWADERELPLIVFASPWNAWEGNPRNLIVWDKGGAMGGGGDIRTCLKRTWELIQVYRNGPMNGNRDVSVWRHAMRGIDTALHICAKPVELMTRLVERFTSPGDTILDPFMGSGTTGVACVNTGRKFIGIELDAEYFKIASARIAAAQAARAEQLIPA